MSNDARGVPANDSGGGRQVVALTLIVLWEPPLIVGAPGRLSAIPQTGPVPPAVALNALALANRATAEIGVALEQQLQEQIGAALGGAVKS